MKMIKRYAILLFLLLVVSMLTTTCSASFLFSDTKVYKNLPENSILKQIFDRVDSSKSNIDTENSVINNQGDSTSNTPLIDGEYTPNEDTVIDTSEEVTTIDINGPIGVEENLVTIDENGKIGQINSENTIEPDGKVGQVLERIIEIITEQNGKVGAFLERVVLRSYASSKEQNADGVIIEGDDSGTATTDISNVVVEGNGGTSTTDSANVVVVTSDQQP